MTKLAGVEDTTIDATKDKFVSALEMIEDDETTDLSYISIPDMNLISHPSETTKDDDDGYSNCTELLSNASKLGKASETRTNAEWEGQSSDETTDIVVIT